MRTKLAVSLKPRPAVLASLLVLALVGVSSASAQVNVTATGGALAASYTTVKGASMRSTRAPIWARSASPWSAITETRPRC